MNGKKLIELKEELFETGYVSFNLKDEVIFLEYKNFIQPICKALNIKEDMLNDLYEVIKEWIEYVFKIKGTIM